MTGSDKDKNGSDKKSWFPGGQSHGWGQELWGKGGGGCWCYIKHNRYVVDPPGEAWKPQLTLIDLVNIGPNLRKSFVTAKMAPVEHPYHIGMFRSVQKNSWDLTISLQNCVYGGTLSV